MKKIVIFASGSGSNALNIIHYFKNNPTTKVVAVFCNNSKAGVIEKAYNENIPVVVFSKLDFQQEQFENTLEKYQPDLIVLAGFLLLFPSLLVSKYENKILNVHPALLPKYGGKGMYGDNVHKAVIANGEKEHGVTIHRVNTEYDKGEIILQESFRLEENESLESVLQKIHTLEFKLYPLAIDKVLNEK